MLLNVIKVDHCICRKLSSSGSPLTSTRLSSPNWSSHCSCKVIGLTRRCSAKETVGSTFTSSLRVLTVSSVRMRKSVVANKTSFTTQETLLEKYRWFTMSLVGRRSLPARIARLLESPRMCLMIVGICKNLYAISTRSLKDILSLRYGVCYAERGQVYDQSRVIVVKVGSFWRQIAGLQWEPSVQLDPILCERLSQHLQAADDRETWGSVRIDHPNSKTKWRGRIRREVLSNETTMWGEDSQRA